jgi:hypothetical protein
MMGKRWLVVVVSAVVWIAWAETAGAAEYYVWKDSDGRTHYSNMPVTGADTLPVAVDDLSRPKPAPSADGTADSGDPAATARQADPAFSTQASLQRQSLERDMRATDRRLQAVGGQLASLGRAVPPDIANDPKAAEDFGLTDQQRALASERDELAKHKKQLRADYDKLHDNVTKELGGTPSWWVDVR